MIVLSLLLAGTSFQETTGLDRSVAAFTGRAIGDDGGARTPVDPRLRLARCPTVALSWRTEGRDAVVVACSGPDWRIFVPVRSIARSAASTTEGRAVPGFAAAKAPIVIKRGDPVMIEAGTDGFSITREGTALSDAAQGARVMIRVADARSPVQGVAVEPGRATLPGWPN